MKKKKKNNKSERPMRCPYCGSRMELKLASEIYKNPDAEGTMYVCCRYPACNTYVLTKRGTTEPLGTPADANLRNLRIRAHREFDRMWRDGLMTRKSAYRWMADSLDIPLKDAHIGLFREYQCQAIIQKCQELREFRLNCAC